LLRLAVSTAYLVEGLHTALQTPAGRRLGHPILATVQARPGVGVDIGYFEDVERAARPIAGVTGTAWAAPLPGNQPTWQSFRIESHQIPVREVALDMAWFTAESFGGPPRFTDELGFGYIIDVHRHLQITDKQRQRFVEVYLEALDEADMPNDEPFRRAVREHVEFGAHIAQQNSRARTDAELHPIREVPHWEWAG